MSKSERYSDTNLAYFMLRATLGLNICIHGVSRILQGPGVFANSLVGSFHKTPLPDWSVHLFGLGLPWVEMLLGGLVLFGVSLRLALFGGAFLIFLLTLGSSLLQDWNAAGPATYLRHDLCRIVGISGQRLPFGGLPAAHRRSFLSHRIQSTECGGALR
jgi:thiosulfate dehydrogenase (quinone) large subunit